MYLFGETYTARQYCIAKYQSKMYTSKFRTVYIDGKLLKVLFIIIIIIIIIIIGNLLCASLPIRKTDKIKQAKYRKYLFCGHLSSKQIHLYVCVNY